MFGTKSSVDRFFDHHLYDSQNTSSDFYEYYNRLGIKMYFYVVDNDYKSYEEVQQNYNLLLSVYNWVLSTNCLGDPMRITVCMSGGFKTMTADMLNVANWLGCNACFHTLVEGQLPNTKADIDAFLLEGKIMFPVALSSPGYWGADRSELRGLFTSSIISKQLTVSTEPNKPNGYSGKTYPMPSFLQVENIIYQAGDRAIPSRPELLSTLYKAIMGDEFDLSFKPLYFVNQSKLLKLKTSLDPISKIEIIEKSGKYEKILSMPKIELHTHLGGFGTDPETLTLLAQAALIDIDEPAYKNAVDKSTAIGKAEKNVWAILNGQFTPSKLRNNPLSDDSIKLTDYFAEGNQNGSQLLVFGSALKEQIRLMYRHFVEQNIVYAEVRCSPFNYSVPEVRSSWDVLADIINTFNYEIKNNTEHTCIVNLIIIASRKEEDLSGVSRHLSLALSAWDHYGNLSKHDNHQCRVVGVDLAGVESPEYFLEKYAEEFRVIRRSGIYTTVHAGESKSLESLWQALYSLNADRIGHGLDITRSPDLKRIVRHKGIGIEMCPAANWQIMGMGHKHQYPLSDYLESQLNVTVNTDNIGISALDLSQNLMLAHTMSHNKLNWLQLLRLQRNAINVSFTEREQKTEILNLYEQRLDEWLSKF